MKQRRKRVLIADLDPEVLIAIEKTRGVMFCVWSRRRHAISSCWENICPTRNAPRFWRH